MSLCQLCFFSLHCHCRTPQLSCFSSPQTECCIDDIKHHRHRLAINGNKWHVHFHHRNVETIKCTFPFPSSKPSIIKTLKLSVSIIENLQVGLSSFTLMHGWHVWTAMALSFSCWNGKTHSRTMFFWRSCGYLCHKLNFFNPQLVQVSRELAPETRHCFISRTAPWKTHRTTATTMETMQPTGMPLPMTIESPWNTRRLAITLEFPALKTSLSPTLTQWGVG